MEILNIPMAIVHVFFIPMISMFLFYQKNKKAIKLDGEFLVRYCIYTTVIVTIVKIITSVIFMITSIRIKIDSTYFGVMAIFVSICVTGQLVEFIKSNFEIKFVSGHPDK